MKIVCVTICKFEHLLSVICLQASCHKTDGIFRTFSLFNLSFYKNETSNTLSAVIMMALFDLSHIQVETSYNHPVPSVHIPSNRSDYLSRKNP